MKTETNYDSLFWEILAKERLVDLSQFHRTPFFEEVPLLSRASDLKFLAEHSEDEANAILLRFALKFLKSVLAYEEHGTPYFAAITVWSPSEDDLIVPNLFVWSGAIQELQERLTLHAATTPFGKKIARLIAKPRWRGRFEALEDTTTTPDMSRVFVAAAEPPYRSVVTLKKFRKQISRTN